MAENTPTASMWRYEFDVPIYAIPHEGYRLGAACAPRAGLAWGGRGVVAHFC
jgi:hypothetical protein